MKAFNYLLVVLICVGSITPEIFAGRRNSYRADSQSTPGQQDQKNQSQPQEVELPEDINPNEDWDDAPKEDLNQPASPESEISPVLNNNESIDSTTNAAQQESAGQSTEKQSEHKTEALGQKSATTSSPKVNDKSQDNSKPIVEEKIATPKSSPKTEPKNAPVTDANNNNEPAQINPEIKETKITTPKSSRKSERVTEITETLKQVVDEMVKPSVNISNEIKEAVRRTYNAIKANQTQFMIMPFATSPKHICDNVEFKRSHYCQYVEEAYNFEDFEKNDEQKAEIIINALENAFALRAQNETSDYETGKKQIKLWKKRIDEIKSPELKQKINECFGSKINYESDGESLSAKDNDGLIILNQKPDLFYAKFKAANELRKANQLSDTKHKNEITIIEGQTKDLTTKIRELQKQLDDLTLQKEQLKEQLNKAQAIGTIGLTSMAYLRKIEEEKYTEIINTGKSLITENSALDTQIEKLNGELENNLPEEQRTKKLLTVKKLRTKKETNMASIKDLQFQEKKAQKRNPDLKKIAEIKLPEVKSSGWSLGGLGWLTSSDNNN